MARPAIMAPAEDNKLSNKALFYGPAEREGVPFVKVNPAYTSKTDMLGHTDTQDMAKPSLIADKP